MSSVLETEELRRQFGRLVAVDDVNVSIKADEITSIIGPNGAGKTTFYNLLTGRLEPTSGAVRLRPRDSEADLIDVTDKPPHEIASLGLSRGFQINNVFDGLTVGENLRIARISRDGRTLDFRAIADTDDDLDEGVRDIAELVGVTDILDTECANLSHGDKRKVEIALALATDPSIVLLDEPTAGMNATETTRMVELVERLDAETDTTFVITEHDMEVVLGISDRILVLDNGELIADGAPDEVLADSRVREAYLGLDEDEELDASSDRGADAEQSDAERGEAEETGGESA